MQVDISIFILMKKSQKNISHILLIFWILMKWVNPEKKLLLRLTLSSAKSGIVIYIWVLYWLYFILMILKYIQLGVINVFETVSLLQKWHHKSWNRKWKNQRNLSSLKVLYLELRSIKKGNSSIHKERFYSVYLHKKIFQDGITLNFSKLYLDLKYWFLSKNTKGYSFDSRLCLSWNWCHSRSDTVSWK